MVVNCEEVWREISNYLEDDVEPSLRAAYGRAYPRLQALHCCA